MTSGKVFRLTNLRIPAFPLGALLALGLFGIGFVFAFPDDDYTWLWELVIAVAILLWAVGAGLFAALQPEEFRPPREIGRESEAPSDDRKNAGLSRSVSALVEAINAHSRSSVAEERAEDYGAGLRERITIVLLAITMIAVIFQVIEMKKVYEPIKHQALLMHNNMIDDHRAWIGPNRGVLDQPVINKAVTANIYYINTGKQPAPLAMNAKVKAYTYENWAVSGLATSEIAAFHDECFANESPLKPGLIAFPGSAQSAYQFTISDSEVIVDQSILSGDKVIVVLACFLYKSYGTIRHTTYCGYDLSGSSFSANLAYCPTGNDAD